ncbi:MAG TPA: YncE family protein [Methylomirabilota bacterium]|nr:YncE family protein [Methylomirabilota bacterium]
MTIRRAAVSPSLGPVLVALAAVLALASCASAQLAISANDNKVVLVNGATTVVRNPQPDTVTLIDLGASPPRVLAEVANVPNSVDGPPLGVTITPDESLALVTSPLRIDPGDPARQIFDNRMSVIDLKASPPAVIATLETGRRPAGVSINRQGTLALVANRGDGTVSVFGIQGQRVTPLGSVKVGDEKSQPSHVAITPDGRRALVTRDGDHRISVLSIDGTRVEYAKRDMAMGLRPYAIDVSADGSLAVVGNQGGGFGDSDTVSVIDLRAAPPRVVETITVGQRPEGVKLSPDGRVVAVIVMNGSERPRESPFYNDAGRLVLLRVDGLRLTRLAEAPIGHWPQGVALSADGRTILVGNMVERNVQVFRWDGASLVDTQLRINVNGGSASLRTADKP